MSLLQAPVRLAEAVEAGGLDPPGRAQAARDGARQEGPEALPQPRAGRVLGSGDANVVAAVVLDEEVAVAGLGEGDAAQPALDVVALVAELVGGVDRDAADDPHRQRQPEALQQREVAARPEPAGEDEPGVLDRDEEVGAPAVVAVLLEPLEHAVGRVGRVDPDRDVEQREDAEDEQRPEEPEDLEAGDFDAGPGDEGSEGNDQAEQPGVALGVAPGRRVEFDLRPVIVAMRRCLHRPSSLSNIPEYVLLVYKIARFVNRRNKNALSVRRAFDRAARYHSPSCTRSWASSK